MTLSDPNHDLSSWQIIICDHGNSSSVIMEYHYLWLWNIIICHYGTSWPVIMEYQDLSSTTFFFAAAVKKTVIAAGISNCCRSPVFLIRKTGGGLFFKPLSLITWLSFQVKWKYLGVKVRKGCGKVLTKFGPAIFSEGPVFEEKRSPKISHQNRLTNIYIYIYIYIYIFV